MLCQLLALKEKYALIGDIRGKGLFLGIELVENRNSKVPVDESVSAKVAALCMTKGVIIGRTNRSFTQFNNTLCLSPALIITEQEVDSIVSALDFAFSQVSDTLD